MAFVRRRKSEPFQFATSTASLPASSACNEPSSADQRIRLSPAGLAANNIVLPLSFEGDLGAVAEARASLQSHLRHDRPEVIPVTRSRGAGLNLVRASNV
jgi:hypothetical protein